MHLLKLPKHYWTRKREFVSYFCENKRNGCIDDILDEEEIVSVDLPEVLDSAGPPGKLVVWIVLCHHYSIAIPGV